MRGFRYTSYAQEIIFGPGSLARLDEAVERFHWQRLMLCSTGSLRRDGSIAMVEVVIGKRLVATYDHVQPHVPDFQVVEATALAHENEVDAVIGLGGGSVIGMAKASRDCAVDDETTRRVYRLDSRSDAVGDFSRRRGRRAGWTGRGSRDPGARSGADPAWAPGG